MKDDTDAVTYLCRPGVEWYAAITAQHIWSLLIYSIGSVAVAVSIASTCPETDICYQLNIPETTATSGNGDIYFRISASTTYEWVALGQGSQMAGSNIFVVYTSSNGQNITVSPRLATGHVMPKHDTAAQITVPVSYTHLTLPTKRIV